MLNIFTDIKYWFNPLNTVLLISILLFVITEDISANEYLNDESNNTHDNTYKKITLKIIKIFLMLLNYYWT